ncbi:hypothetical protein ACH40E_36375 [Streptomyces acidicola]|uniref:hypothetical protein n=1 Tax=Streptomyces acidicola TaxID=2596892 RepID=UPI0037A0B99F
MPNLAYPFMAVDGLLRAAAVRDPERFAVRTGHGARTLREPDAPADRIATPVGCGTGRRPGARAGVASVLGPVSAPARDTTEDAVREQFEAKTALGRSSTPQEVAAVAGYSASVPAASTTAQALDVCGGPGNF